MNKEDWIWMPHPGHFILGHSCRFKMTTYVGGYLVSTVGELWNEEGARRIHAEIHDPEWYEANKHLKGDMYSKAHFNKFGFAEIGLNRRYETMVFKAGKSGEACCPYEPTSYDGLDFEGYNDPESARVGHMKYCEKWSKPLPPTGHE